jgi:hypothetical protein
MADVDDTLPEWSSTSASNKPTGATTIGTNLDDNLREVQGVVTRWLSHKGADIASAGTTDIGAVDGLMHDITGAATVTGLGTIRAGIWKVLKFEGAALLTHNATSLILLTGANRTTVAGDVGIYMSEGSGNWRELCYMPVNTQLTNSGVKFAATQAASSDANTLDDYEEGTWTPTLTFSTAGDLSVTYSVQAGAYTKVGNVVTVSANIVTSAFTHTTAASNCRVTGLPFTASATGRAIGAVLFQGITNANLTQLVAQVENSTDYVEFLGSKSATNSVTIAAADMPTGGSVILRFSVTYRA